MNEELCQRRFNFLRSACVLYEFLVSQRDQLRYSSSGKISCFPIYIFQYNWKNHQYNITIIIQILIMPDYKSEWVDSSK